MGGGDFKLVGFNHATGLISLFRRQIYLNPVWLGGLRSCGFAALSLGPFGLATRPLSAHPPNWIQTYLALRDEAKPVGLIESFGALPQTLGRLRRKNIAAQGSAPRPPLGLRSRPRWGSAPNRIQQGVWGGALPAVWGRSPKQHSCIGAAPGFGAEPPPSWLWHCRRRLDVKWGWPLVLSMALICIPGFSDVKKETFAIRQPKLFDIRKPPQDHRA